MGKFFDDENTTDFESEELCIEDIDAFETYDEDTWAEELRYKIENAIEVWIA